MKFKGENLNIKVLFIIFILLLPKVSFSAVFSDDFNNGVISSDWNNPGPNTNAIAISENINLGFLTMYDTIVSSTSFVKDGYLSTTKIGVKHTDPFEVILSVDISNSSSTQVGSIYAGLALGNFLYSPANIDISNLPLSYILRRIKSGGYTGWSEYYDLFAKVGSNYLYLGTVPQTYGNLKITYDGAGNWDFYFNDILKGTYSYLLNDDLYFLIYTEVVGNDTTFNVDTRFDFITATGNLIFPSVLTQAHLYNLTRPLATNIQLGEQFKVSAIGTPNQTNVKGAIGNANRIGQPNSGIGTMFSLTETPIGSGNYEYTGTLTTTIDNGGFAATKIAGAASNDNFSSVVMAIEQLIIITPPPQITTATLLNLTRLGATDIQLGETIKLTAQGTPNQLNIIGVIANANRIGSPDAIIGTPFNLTETPVGSGYYDSLPIALTTDRDNGGNLVTKVVAVVTNDNFANIIIAPEQLIISVQNPITSVTLTNLSSPVSTDITVGETYKIHADSTTTGLTNVYGTIINADRQNVGDGAIIEGPFLMNEVASYEVVGVLNSNKDRDGIQAQRISAKVYTMENGVPKSTPTFSNNQLNLAGDLTLGNTPWPTYGQNNKLNFSSPLIGPTSIGLKWALITNFNYASAPVIDSDNDVYFVASSSNERRLYSINGQTGLENWHGGASCAIYLPCEPIILSNGSILVGLSIYSKNGVIIKTYPWYQSRRNEIINNGILYYLESRVVGGTVLVAMKLNNGNILWEVDADYSDSDIAIDNNGILYVAGRNKLIALKDGSELWHYEYSYSGRVNLTIRNDGKIILNNLGKIINPDGTLWKETPKPCSHFSIGFDDALYCSWGKSVFQDAVLSILNSDLSVRVNRYILDSNSGSPLTIDSEGKIYAPNSPARTVSIFNVSGDLLASFSAHSSTDDRVSPIIIGKNKTLFFTVGSNLYAVTNDTFKPSKITDLKLSTSINNLVLSWTTPEDDEDRNNLSGPVKEYDIRYATFPITESNWDSATRINETPKIIWNWSSLYTMFLDLKNLAFQQDTKYYFAMRSIDEVGNISDISNLAEGYPTIKNDLSISVYGNGIARAGSYFEYRIYVTCPYSGVTSSYNNINVNVKLPNQQTYSDSYPLGTYEAITNTIKWHLDNMQCPERFSNGRIFSLTAKTANNVKIGEKLTMIATVTTDTLETTYSNNKFLYQFRVGNSYDPNDKIVLPQGTVTNDEYLSYTIHFENEGNLPAENIKVEDTLDENLDSETLVAGENGYYLPDTRKIIWELENINLPPKGEGQVTFYIKPKSNLPDGTIIKDKASIIFDTNPPISTPEVVTTIGTPLPFAEITTPTDSQFINTSSINIYGSAFGLRYNQFNHYELQYGSGSNPVNWTQITNSQTEVLSNKLATWDISNLSGEYTLRLKAYNQTQNYAESKIKLFINVSPQVTEIKDKIKEPIDVAFDKDNNLYVLDKDNKQPVKKVNLTTNSITSLITQKVEDAKKIVVDNQGTIYLLTEKNVLIFDLSGTLAYTLPITQKGVDIAVDTENKLYLLTTKGETSQVTIYGDSPQPIAQWTVPEQLTSITANYFIYLSSKKEQQNFIKVYTQAGELVANFGSGFKDNENHIVSIDIDNNFNLYALDKESKQDAVRGYNNQQQLYFIYGAKGKGTGSFKEPTGLAVTTDGKILAIADTENKRVQIIKFTPATNNQQIVKTKEDSNLTLTKILILPNPITGTTKQNAKLLVDAQGNIIDAKIEVYNTSGNKILSTPVFSTQLGKGKYKLSSPEVETKLFTLPNGVYFCRVTLSDGINEVSKVGKIVILK